MNILCDLCAGDYLDKVYEPPTTKRGLSIYVCKFCGLIQSIPRIDHVENKEVTTSSGADWGNVRYGKQFDIAEAVEILSRILDKEATKRILDIGAGRDADFLNAIEERNPMLMCYGMEPHFEFDSQYDYDDTIIRYKNRLEDVNLDRNWVDVITFIHTLEHLASPREALMKAYRTLKDDGWILVIVPNMEYLLEQNDVAEELFIDKHLYHFTPLTLGKYMSDCGFITDEARYSNRETIAYLGHKRMSWPKVARDIGAYAKRLENNLNKLPMVANKINEMDNVVIWGAGRILDALVGAGLDTDKIEWIIDNYLPLKMRYNRIIVDAAILDNWCPDTIIICSREYAQAIMLDAETLCPEADIVIWSDLL
jgi:SAM-dependent methyltransferase